jgi:hypothetical protein
MSLFEKTVRRSIWTAVAIVVGVLVIFPAVMCTAGLFDGSFGGFWVNVTQDFWATVETIAWGIFAMGSASFLWVTCQFRHEWR